jgi:hypothetical protein
VFPTVSTKLDLLDVSSLLSVAMGSTSVGYLYRWRKETYYSPQLLTGSGWHRLCVIGTGGKIVAEVLYILSLTVYEMELETM